MVNALYKKPWFTSAPSAEAYLGDLKADGTVPLTAAWDVGAFAITANGFTLANKEPLTFNDGTYSHIMYMSNKEGLAGSDLRIGLDDANQSIIISPRSTIDTDWGQVLHPDFPVLWIYEDASKFIGITPTHITYNSSYSHLFQSNANFISSSDMAAGNVFAFTEDTGKNLTDTDGRQSWMYLAPDINQSGTAAYDALYVNVTETTLGDGTTGNGNNLLNLSVAAVPRLLVDSKGYIAQTATLDIASGDQVALAINYTTNKAAGNDTGLKLVQTDTVSGGISYLIEGYVATTQNFYVSANGTGKFANSILTPLLNGAASGSTLKLKDSNTATAHEVITAATGTYTQTSGELTGLAIKPTYNQTGASSGIDLKVNRTETAVGTGTQRLASFQVAATERVGFDNKGFEIRAYPLACTHNTATALFGITIPAGSTAGGIITYTLNVTDDDGSDDQIEVGTVQFVGLQDEANWHTNISEVSTQAVESGTLATTWAIDTATANTLKVTLLANSNLTTPVYTLSYTVTFNNTYTVATY